MYFQNLDRRHTVLGTPYDCASCREIIDDNQSDPTLSLVENSTLPDLIASHTWVEQLIRRATRPLGGDNVNTRLDVE